LRIEPDHQPAVVRDLSSVELIVIDAPRVDDDLIAATRPMLAVSNSSLFALITQPGSAAGSTSNG